MLAFYRQHFPSVSTKELQHQYNGRHTELGSCLHLPPIFLVSYIKSLLCCDLPLGGLLLLPAPGLTVERFVITAALTLGPRRGVYMSHNHWTAIQCGIVQNLVQWSTE